MPPFRPCDKKSPQHIASVYLSNQSILFDNRQTLIRLIHEHFSDFDHARIHINACDMGIHKICDLPAPVIMVGGIQRDFPSRRALPTGAPRHRC